MTEDTIISKTYKKLIIQLDPKEITYTVLDLLTGNVVKLFHEKFNFVSKTNKILESRIKDVINELILNYKKFDEILVLHNNSYNTFVPNALFDETYLGLYLQYNTKVFESDIFVYDTIERHEIKNIYIPYINMNNILLDFFKDFNYKNSNSILLQKILDVSKNKEENNIYIHYQNTHFEIILVNNQKLRYFNSFEQKTTEDFIYYLLFTFEQLNINPENIKTYFIGDITNNHASFKIAFQYIRNVYIYDVKFLAEKNGATEHENLKHFIVLQA